jgi:hypothetical protein
MCPPHPSENESETNLPPGAERFWGQVSKTRAGRTGPEQDETGPSSDEAGTEPVHECLEWCPICRSAELLREASPAEFRQQIGAIQNEAIQVMKAFAVAYAERNGDDSSAQPPDPAGAKRGDSAKRPDGEPVVTDISID